MVEVARFLKLAYFWDSPQWILAHSIGALEGVTRQPENVALMAHATWNRVLW